jgi:hypothetical protein
LAKDIVKGNIKGIIKPMLCGLLGNSYYKQFNGFPRIFSENSCVRLKLKSLPNKPIL